ncbi:MAG: hypothetical protein BA871_12605 [Desulfuromonadales bacterium C00003096]|jgi:hypothetical protein|nr:MAG: hypothetical protein BA871_12605 [Desulfuromonadales bacterium C00003096]
MCLVLARELSDAGEILIKECPNMMALTLDDGGEGATKFRDIDGEFYHLKGDLWDLGKLVEEVFI